MLSGAEREILALAEKARIPIAVTLLGIGGVPRPIRSTSA